ncbi:MAG TPA: isoaspartyl peptidase/L-asparaginase [Ktedonobacteraceae bacterium]|jgi:beta-aspartyl-peptidase (threonine type)|nr:isoaspartyl peptidase/L-asparaginase [Ktedonobacteraceae bacterium]
MSIAILVHGGAGIIPVEQRQRAHEGCQAAAELGWSRLQSGGTALDAVEEAVRAMEDNPHYNAGTGSCLSIEGNIEMDAGIMDGQSLRVGAVAGLELLKNPIQVARHILESPHALLIGKGAQQFALEQGFSLCKRADLLTEAQYQKWLHTHKQADPRHPKLDAFANPIDGEKKHGTVGAVAIDAHGNLAAATSTGGMQNKHPGRVGDSPLVGCGFYADEYAAISCTGLGEDFIRLLIAQRAASYVAQGLNAQQAAEKAMAFLSEKATGTGGVIIVDRHGNIGAAWNSEHMSYASMQ